MKKRGGEREKGRLVFERFDLFRGKEKIKVPIFTE
jgi:hypothetical protein